MATEGVDYAAGLTTNFLPGGADPVGVDEMKRLLTDATNKYDKSKIVAGGYRYVYFCGLMQYQRLGTNNGVFYSQGAATAHRAIENLPDSVKSKILGVVTYGDTQNQQDKGQIPNFPKDKLKLICNEGDKVCTGTLEITPAHLDYERHVPEAVDFLTGKIGNL